MVRITPPGTTQGSKNLPKRPKRPLLVLGEKRTGRRLMTHDKMQLVTTSAALAASKAKKYVPPSLRTGQQSAAPKAAASSFKATAEEFPGLPLSKSVKPAPKAMTWAVVAQTKKEQAPIALVQVLPEEKKPASSGPKRLVSKRLTSMDLAVEFDEPAREPALQWDEDDDDSYRRGVKHESRTCK